MHVAVFLALFLGWGLINFFISSAKWDSMFPVKGVWVERAIRALFIFYCIYMLLFLLAICVAIWQGW